MRVRFNMKAIRSELLWLYAGINLAIIPHYSRIPFWISLLFVALSLWRLMLPVSGLNRYRDSPLLLLMKLTIGAGIITGILISYGTLTGRDASVALLISLAGLKFLETVQERDYYITVFLGFFLILTGFLFSQTLPMAIYMFVVVWVLIGVLISINDQSGFINTRARLLKAGILLLQSIPLMLVVFLLFPRVPGPLWGLPKDANAALSGISDEMSPGSISDLILSDKIAFRVKFKGTVPEQSLLYWRGPVLWQTDGVKWTQDKPRKPANIITSRANAVEYTVTLEPTSQNWLFGLELPDRPPEDSIFTHDMQIRTRRPVRNIIQYSLVSHTDYKFEPGDPQELMTALQLPHGYHGKAVKLGRSWRLEGLSDREIVNRTLQMFNTGEFYYTLTPPLYLQDSVDEFLFDARRGFCEHYAAAFVVLMRAAGIPARVVTGYQGGTINNIDNYLVVRQRDAHAWTEVWFGNQGWIRIDPTSAVSPERISYGIENALPDSIIDIPLGLQNNAVARNLWLQIRNTYEAVNNRWNQWVLAYDLKQQRNFLNYVGLKDIDWRGMTVWLFAVTCGMFLIVSFWLFRYPAKSTDPVRVLYDDFCRKMAGLGIRRSVYEGPMDFADRAGNLRKDLEQEINNITGLYIAVRYGGEMQSLESLHQQVRMFRPSKLHA